MAIGHTSRKDLQWSNWQSARVQPVASPGGKYTLGLGWDGKNGGDSPDLDAWVVRVHNDGTRVPVGWGNFDLHRPDLGVKIDPETGEQSPWIATPELDVIHQGDDKTGTSSDGGYDEIVQLDTTKAPADVKQYDIFVHYFTEPEDAAGTLGMAENIKCGVKDEASGNELTTQLGDEFAFAQTARVASIARTNGGWSMTAQHNEYSESFVGAGFVDGYAL